MVKAVCTGMYLSPRERFGDDDGGTGYAFKLNHYKTLAREMLKKEGIEFYAEADLPLEKADVVLCIDMTPEIYSKMKALPSRVKKILQCSETTLYSPLSHTVDVLSQPLWDAVITWNRAYSGENIFFYDIPITGKSAAPDLSELHHVDPSQSIRGCVISSFKAGDHRGLAPEREHLYLHLASKGLIDLYGKGWTVSPSKHLMGTTDNKLETFSSYPFALVVENMFTQGYVTEKLPDGILAGVPVIYCGDFQTAERRFPGTFVPLEKITEKAFLAARKELFANYGSLRQAVLRSRENSDSWCDSYLEAIHKAFVLLKTKYNI